MHYHTIWVISDKYIHSAVQAPLFWGDIGSRALYVTYLKEDSNVIAKNCNDVLWGADATAILRSQAL